MLGRVTHERRYAGGDGRRRGARGRGRSAPVESAVVVLFWLSLAVGLLLLAALAAGLAMTVWAYRAATHPRHGEFDAPRMGDALPREPVALTSRDGTRLAAWFIRGSRRQAVLLLH